jgi:hypothetical protein
MSWVARVTLSVLLLRRSARVEESVGSDEPPGGKGWSAYLISN